MEKRTKILQKLLDLFYPKGLTCNGCGKELNDDERKYSLCKTCEGKIFDPENRYFGESYERILPVDGHDEISARGCFRYEDMIRDYVIDYKDDDKTYLTHYMALHMQELYERLDYRAETVVYVPTSRSNKRKRGYDNMKLVAEEFCKLTGLSLGDGLSRYDGTDQSKVAPEKRGENVQGKFFCEKEIPGKVLLLDDVVTSGATVTECAKALFAHGAKEVKVLSFAMAGLKRENGENA